MFTISGVSVGSGIGVGKALTLSREKSHKVADDIFAYDVQTEKDRFLRKSSNFSQKLLQIVNPAKDSVRDLLGAASGFLSSSENRDQILELIERGYSACVAASNVLNQNLDSFYHNDDDNSEDRAELKAIISEFVHTLEHSRSDSVELPKLTEDVILVAGTLSPAQLLSLDNRFLKGVVLEEGRDSGHLGVVLRELNIPAVCGVFDATTIPSGTEVIVDSNSAVIIVEPTADITAGMMNLQAKQSSQINDESLLNITIGAAVGAISQSEDYQILSENGLGLLRSEFLFLSNVTEPSEDQMRDAFYGIFVKVPHNSPLTARTFDFADDKKPLFPIRNDQSGPLRDYGACVGTELLRKEIRALLRAAVDRTVTIVFPLITKISEKDYLVALANDCLKELEKEGRPHGRMDISLMVETPAAVLLAKALAQDSSMMLLGTSSLAEYASAPCQPDTSFTPVLAKMMVMAAKAACEAGVTLGVAGRFASRMELFPFFYRLGVSYLVTGTYNIQSAKSRIEKLNLEKDIRPEFDPNLYERVMNTNTGAALTELINELSN